jgi:hypothetical protein
MMAGHPNDASPLSLRNTPFSIQVGGLDTAYNRNVVAQKWGAQLSQLKADDPDGYIHYVKLHKGKGHWMNLADAPALPWMHSHTRNPLPVKVVWKQNIRHHTRFFWLGTLKNNIQTGGEIAAEYNRGRNEINILSNYANIIQVYVNDNMLDLDRPVTIKYMGQQIFKGALHRTIVNLYRSLYDKGDPNLAFPVSASIIRNQKIVEPGVDLSVDVAPARAHGPGYTFFTGDPGNHLTIIFTRPLRGGARIKVTNIRGDVIAYVFTSEQATAISLPAPGVYIATITTGRQQSAFKFVKK